MIRHNRGFSLVELLVAIALFGFISAGIVIAMRTSLQTTHLSRNLDELSISLNHSINTMRRDIEQAGRFVSQGIRIPNNPGNTEIRFGFDLGECLNDIGSAIIVNDPAGQRIGTIPAGTDTIAIATMAPPIQLALVGCDPAEPPIGPQRLSVNYLETANIEVQDASEFSCYLANHSGMMIFAILFGLDGQNIISEMFTIADINANTITIANDAFSNGTLSREYSSQSMVYLLGANPSVGKIEYFILESDQQNPSDPDVPLRQLVKRTNNRDVFPVADNITNLQVRYNLFNGTRVADISAIHISNANYPVVVEIVLTARSSDMVRGDSNTPDDFDPVTGTNIARYIEETYHSFITIKGTTYKQTNEVGAPYFP